MHNGESNYNCHVLHDSMYEYLQNVEPLDDNQYPHEIVLFLTQNIMTLKYLNLNLISLIFYQPQKHFLTTI